MTLLILGLLLFLGTHSVRLFADDWRTRTIARIGDQPWRGIYSLLSVAGIALIVLGYGTTRGAPDVWTPPLWLRPATTVLSLLAFYLIAAAFVPRTRARAMLWHPMVAGVKLWAFAHLLSNGRPGDLLLFGAFLAWAIIAFSTCRRRDRASGRTYPPGSLRGDLIAFAIGGALWLAFMLWLHRWVAGVPVVA
jgi:uncharacterized membrane protein